ncbi:MAG: glycosyltransferase [Lachnospiraceae bacterium]|nr:glycosyltransferase [Lachnospiraceae bacterium]
MYSFSIIIPIYNAERTLEPCIKSVLKQSFFSYEILLIDNNSTDHSAVICKRFLKTDSRVKYFLCKEQGVSAARNYGIEKANGKYLFFLDADDLIHFNFLEIAYKFLRDYNTDLLIPRIVRFSQNIPKKITTKSEIPRFYIYNSKKEQALSFATGLSVYRHFQVPKIIKRSIINSNKIRFICNCSIGEDLLFNLECLKHCQKSAYNEGLIYFYRYSHAYNQNLSRKYRPDVLKERKKIIFTVQKYLRENNYFQDFRKDFYAFCMNEFFACIVNAFHPLQADGKNAFNSIVRDLFFIKALTYKFYEPKLICKKIFLQFLSRRKYRTAAFIIKALQVLGIA